MVEHRKPIGRVIAIILQAIVAAAAIVVIVLVAINLAKSKNNLAYNIIILIVATLGIINAVIGFIGTWYGQKDMRKFIIFLVINFAAGSILALTAIVLGLMPFALPDSFKYWGIYFWDGFSDIITKTAGNTVDEKFKKFQSQLLPLEILTLVFALIQCIAVIGTIYLMGAKHFIRYFITCTGIISVIFGLFLIAIGLAFRFIYQPEGYLNTLDFIILFSGALCGISGIIGIVTMLHFRKSRLVLLAFVISLGILTVLFFGLGIAQIIIVNTSKVYMTKQVNEKLCVGDESTPGSEKDFNRVCKKVAANLDKAYGCSTREDCVPEDTSADPASNTYSEGMTHIHTSYSSQSPTNVDDCAICNDPSRDINHTVQVIFSFIELIGLMSLAISIFLCFAFITSAVGFYNPWMKRAQRVGVTPIDEGNDEQLQQEQQ
ncbi:MAG: hypothetical protein EZS28_004454 [Streblomastix strix]|uniref:Tetraspanin family protein n=1 Tax=Streblomastix strix TaxID=222440 RepID=A0A5J4WZQ8_9EUKA|nr:MAG: hypothetical protein EZS28_004454 [Streblomastix strix]